MARYRTNVALAIKGDRIERGSEVELSAKEAAQLDPKDITLVSDIPALEPEAELSAIPLEEMSHAQLKERAKELDLSMSGSKADLQERIALHLAGSADDQSEEDEVEGDGETTDDQSEEDEVEGDEEEPGA